MHWNHRVVAFEDSEFGEIQYGIHEVYYDNNGTIDGWSKSPVDVAGESLEVLQSVLARMAKAAEQPVLWWEGDSLVEDNE